MTTTILADGAYTAGVLVGRLIPILPGALILAVGLSSDPVTLVATSV